MSIVDWLTASPYKTQALASSYVTSQGLSRYVHVKMASNSKNLKALCIPRGDGSTKFLEKKNEKRSNKNNNVAHYIALRDIKFY